MTMNGWITSRVDADGAYHSPNVCYATEGPLIHDGSQTTANADLSGPAAYNPGGTGAALLGQQSSGQFLAVKLVGARLVDLCVAGDLIYGVLQNKPAAGQAADVGIMGVSKMVSGGTIAAGAALMTDANGRFVTAATTAARVGVAIEAAGAAGVIFTGAIVPGENTRNVT